MRLQAQSSFPFDLAGQILKRQTTYWEIAFPGDGVQSSQIWRVNFLQKKEFVFQNEHFPHSRLIDAQLDSHPLLIDYQQWWGDLYVSSPAMNPKDAIALLDTLIHEETAGWRPLKRYLNAMADISLREGYGLLLHGPRALVDKAQVLLAGMGITTHIFQPKPAITSQSKRAITPVQLLLLGSNYIIAGSFTAEQRT